MVLDADTKAVLERQHNETLELISGLRRDLVRSNEINEKLNADNAILKADNVSLRTELATVRAEVTALKKNFVDHKRESAEAIRTAVDKAVADQVAVTKGLRVDIDDLEQYGRRKSIRVQNVKVVHGEKDDKSQDLLLKSVNETLMPAGIALEHSDIIRFHRSSAMKDDKDVPFGKVSQLIIKCRNWRIRSQFQGLNGRMRDIEKTPWVKGCRVYHDLTKRRLALLNQARDDCVNGWFAYADTNSNLKIRKGDQVKNFNTIDELKAIIAEIGGGPDAEGVVEPPAVEVEA